MTQYDETTLFWSLDKRHPKNGSAIKKRLYGLQIVDQIIARLRKDCRSTCCRDLRQKSLRFSLNNSIVEASGISINKDCLDKREYQDRVIQLAYHIHSVFVRIKYPEIDQKIVNSRAYPDMLSMSLFSIFISSIILGILFFIRLYNIGFIYVYWFFYFIMIVIVWRIISVGMNKVKMEYEKLNELTKYLIIDVFKKNHDNDKENREELFKLLRGDKCGLIEEDDINKKIVIDGQNKWIVKCSDLSW